MSQNYTGAEWTRILELLTWFQEHVGKVELLYSELSETDQVKVWLAMACRLESPNSLKVLETMITNFAPELVISALQIMPRKDLSSLALQSFEGRPFSQAMKLIVDSLSQRELIFLAFLSFLTPDMHLFMNFVDNLTPARREELLEEYRKKEGRA